MKIVFMGTPQAAVPALEKIIEDGHEVVAVWTQPDRPSGRGNKVTSPPVKEYALRKGLKVVQPEKIKNKESIGLFKSHDADVAVVVAYGRILSQSYLNAFPNGCINLHFSLLPKYRGAAPVNWAIVNGETNTGVTTMKMDRGLDTGDILLQRETAIGENENSIELMDRLSLLGADLLSETLSRLDDLKPVEQDDDDATLAPMMSKEDGIIDWSMTATDISNRVRGFQPFPRSFTNHNLEKLTIWRSEVADCSANDSRMPGEIVNVNNEEIIVKCGSKTYLRIVELQLAGKRRMNVNDFLNGVRIEAGAGLS